MHIFKGKTASIQPPFLPARSRNCCMLIRTRYYSHRFPRSSVNEARITIPGQFVSRVKSESVGITRFVIRRWISVPPNRAIVHMHRVSVRRYPRASIQLILLINLD